MLVPSWLEPLLKTKFFTVCGIHSDAARSERNMYCLDCNCDAFCFYCKSSKHKDHQVIQIRRSSYHDVVRVSEIPKALDIDGVQTYVINSAKVVFLNERPQPRGNGGKGAAHICEICGRNLLDPFRFCSISCKIAGINKIGDESFNLEARNEISMGRRLVSLREIEDSHQKPQIASSTRRRKGIPHRAPFGS